MERVFITGCGILTPFCNGIDILQDKNINDFPIAETEQIETVLTEDIVFKAKRFIKPEDRSLLNNDAKKALDVSLEAFEMAEKNMRFSAEEKEDFPVFITNETFPYRFKDSTIFIDNYMTDNENVRVDSIWKELGKFREYLNPLDMLRSLTTNPLYHISKLFGLRGGGYPIRRMSLSSLCCLEEAFNQLKINKNRALIVGVGDLTVPDNRCVFEKMGLVKNKFNNDGIVPSFGAASVILEQYNDTNTNKRICFGEIINCKTNFLPHNNISKGDWFKLFSSIDRDFLQDLIVISYDNGNKNLTQIEHDAIKSFLPKANIFNYKKYIGYTGKANNLMDLVLALADKRIKPGSNVLVNGVGNYAGLGYILFKKLVQLNGNVYAK